MLSDENSLMVAEEETIAYADTDAKNKFDFVKSWYGAEKVLLRIELHCKVLIYSGRNMMVKTAG